MKVFLDTNVLVSAYTARGLCADLLRQILAEHELLTGEVNLTELRRVLRDRFHAPPALVAAVEAELRDNTIVPWVLASAVAGAADMLVTGDQDLLTVANQAPLPIVDPRGCWDRLRA